MIAVIGDVMLDKYIYGSSTRMSPECDSAPVIKQYATETCVGGAGNTALNIKNLDTEVILFCALSKHSELRKLLRQEDIYYKDVVNYNQDVVKTRIINNGEYIARLDYDYLIECNQDNLVEYLFKSNPDLIVVSDYDKGTLDAIPKIINKANSLNIKTLIDPKKDLTEYKNSYILKPNLKEFCEWLNFDNTIPDEELINKLNSNLLLKARDMLNVNNLVITLGSSGCIIVDQNSNIKKINALPVKAKDVTGAGDSFIAALAVSLQENNNVFKAVEFATKVAGIAVTKRGTSYVKRNEI